jgi:hypothetical protein
MHKDRLIKLAELLERDAKDPTGVKFDLGTWAAPSEPFERWRKVYWSAESLGLEWNSAEPTWVTNAAVAPDKMPKVACGTTACALGLAMISGEFAQWGMGGSADIEADGDVMLAPSCNGKFGFQAGAELFGITEEDSIYLFDPPCYGDITPKEAEGELMVAQRIRDFVAGTIDDQWHPDTRDRDCFDDED